MMHNPDLIDIFGNVHSDCPRCSSSLTNKNSYPYICKKKCGIVFWPTQHHYFVELQLFMTPNTRYDILWRKKCCLITTINKREDWSWDIAENDGMEIMTTTEHLPYTLTLNQLKTILIMS